MKREVAAEIVDSLKEAGVDFVASLTEANLHDLVIALGEIQIFIMSLDCAPPTGEFSSRFEGGATGSFCC